MHRNTLLFMLPHRPALLAACLLTAVLGRGSLGEDLFAEKILPIVKGTCIECHGPDKQKSDLRLDSAAWFQEGSGGTPVIKPGNPDDSELLYRIELPSDDPDVMPPKGDPLSKEQIELIRKWIEQGAPYGDAATAAPAEKEADADSAAPANILEQLAKSVPPGPESAIAALDGLVMPIAQNSPLVRLDFQFYEGEIDEEIRNHLEELTEQITWVNLKGRSLEDDDLRHLATLPHITRLHLENTAVGDAGLVHLSNLQYLEYLNLYGTQVTDAGLDHLTGLTNLKNLYLWQSAVTPAGAAKLKAALPNLYINLGAELYQEEEEAGPLNLANFFDAESCCGKAHKKEEACEHPCCQAAAKEGQICLKCNPGAEKLLLSAARQAVAALPAQEKQLDVLSLLFDEGSCCSKAHQKGEECDHLCCAQARLLGTVCSKCNSGAEKRLSEFKD